MLQSGTYDCILPDSKVPRMDGRQVYKLLRELDKSAAEGIIFITKDTAYRDTQDFVYSTGILIMNKPFQLDELLSQIGKWLMETEAAKSRRWPNRAQPAVSLPRMGISPAGS